MALGVVTVLLESREAKGRANAQANSLSSSAYTCDRQRAYGTLRTRTMVNPRGRMRSFNCFASLALFLICSQFFICLRLHAADKVFKWQDSQGVIHYSNRPGDKDARPAELPPIMRGEVKLASPKLLTCDAHGGVSCRAGNDTDGSVICNDGFRNSSQRFRFTCAAPKLDIADISDVTPEGGFSVFIRNSKSVAANKPAVAFSRPDGTKVVLNGPAEVEPFGSAEFVYQASDGVQLKDKPTFAQLNVVCENCPQ